MLAGAEECNVISGARQTISSVLRTVAKYARRLLRPRREQTLQERLAPYSVGRGSYGDLSVSNWGEGASLTVGAFCSFASGVRVFLGGEHRTDWVTTYPFSQLWEAGAAIKGHPKTKGSVHIGNDVWVGTDVLILSGVHVGDGAVIGARAVVARDVPPYSIVAGNPASVQRMRFDEVTVRRLLEVRWWEWEDAKIARFLPLLLSQRIDVFLAEAENG